MAEEKGVWRTIRGRRVFIREGEDLASAMKRSGKFKNITDVKREEYQDLKAELKANKTDYLVRQDAKEQKLYTGDTSDLKGKHIYKYSTETQEQLDKASSLRDLNTGRIYDKTAIDQYKSRKDGYYYYIDTNVKNRDNPQYETYKDYVKRTLNNDEYLQANRPNEYFQKQLRESGVKTFGDEIKEGNSTKKDKTLADVYSYTDKQIDEGKNPLFNFNKPDEIKEGNPIKEMASQRVHDIEETLNNDKILLNYAKKKGLNGIDGTSIKELENRIGQKEKYISIAKGNNDTYKGTQYERKYNSVDEAIADRDSKLNRYINTKTPLEKMTRQQLAEYIVDDQISRGIVKEESRAMQVQGRLKGMGASKSMSKKELYLGAKDTQLAKMSLSELRKEAQKYNIDTIGLNAQELRAKLIAIFK